MPTPPLPDTPCIRVNLTYNTVANADAGNRFFFSYAGSAPTPANCVTLATDILAAWHTNMDPLLSSAYGLQEVDVLDIATHAGASGQATGTNSGGRTGTNMPIQCALGVEFGIARRYRGGKPRAYFPIGVDSDLLNAKTFATAFVTSCQTDIPAFFAAVEALSVGAVGALAHVNLSYYQGFQNFTTPSGRERAVPKYRATALHDNVESYAVKALISSQKRRRTSSTP